MSGDDDALHGYWEKLSVGGSVTGSCGFDDQLPSRAAGGRVVAFPNEACGPKPQTAVLIEWGTCATSPAYRGM